VQQHCTFAEALFSAPFESCVFAVGFCPFACQTQRVQVGRMFQGDWMQHYQTNIPAMLAGGVRVLVYAGDVDFVCNYKGNKAWTLALEWPHKGSVLIIGLCSRSLTLLHILARSRSLFSSLLFSSLASPCSSKLCNGS
jgi:hypothetical protein